MLDVVALWIGRVVMALFAWSVVAGLAAVIIRETWVHVIRPVHLLADYQEWRRAKASGAWQWPRVTERPTTQEGPKP